MKINKITGLLLIIAFSAISNSMVSSFERVTDLAGIQEVQHKIKILTWNIYMLPFCSEIHRNRLRSKAIAEEIPTYNYDIVVFEEAFDHQARKSFGINLRNISRLCMVPPMSHHFH